MQISCDWNGRNFVPLNSFHPILLFLLNKKTNYFKVFDINSKRKYQQYLSNNQFYKHLINSKKQSLVWNYFDPMEQFLTEVSESDVYITHTFPLNLNIKPFIFHFETLSSFFFPIADSYEILSKKKNSKSFQKLKEILKTNLENSNCLGIIVHLEKSKEQLNNFFNSKKILDKTFVINPFRNNFHINRGIKRVNTFLFSNSLHGSKTNLNQED